MRIPEPRLHAPQTRDLPVLGVGPPRLVYSRAAWLLLLAGMMLFPASTAWAQVQRSFANLGFEQPAMNTAGCRVYINSSQVPGWQTTHPNQATENSGGCVVAGGLGASPGPIIELWRTPRNNDSGGTVNARSGVQIAELNAAVSSRIFQNVCLINGERVEWRFSHRGRSSATVRDVADMKIGASSTIVRVGTTNNGAINTPVASQGVVDTPVNAPGNTSWVDYRGRFTYAGATGTTNMGFESVGGSTSGNLLDEIQIELAPFVEFTQPSSSTPESASNNLPTLRINGTTYAAFNITVQITGGTATLGTDFTTPGNSPTMTIAVPAGNYDGVSAGSLFALPITITQDTVVEGNETIEMQVQPSGASPASYQLSSSAVCGGPPQRNWIYTIIDDDSSINVSKNAAAPVAVAGQPTQFDVAYTLVVNNPTSVSANYALTDTPGLDANASIVSASYSLNSGASNALAGSGPWTLQPPWRALAGGATDTYVLTVRININRGGSTGNDSCATPTAAGSGLHNSASAVLQGTPTNTTFTSSACRNTPTPVWATLRKQLTARAIASDQVQIRLLSAGTPAATATTTGSASPSTASTALVVLPAGNTMQFEEAVKAAGTGPDQAPSNYGTQLSCTNANTGSTTVLPSGAGVALATRQQWAEFTPAGGDDLDCLITNNPVRANLSITKSNATTSVVSGSTVNYSIVVSNAGPQAASGAIVRDPVAPGLSCTTASCGSETNGATCPGPTGPALASALQSGAGAVIGALPANSAVTLSLTCTVTATGLP
jgi:uncharacterized repeat protein (TIGR01451 family)